MTRMSLSSFTFIPPLNTPRCMALMSLFEAKGGTDISVTDFMVLVLAIYHVRKKYIKIMIGRASLLSLDFFFFFDKCQMKNVEFSSS